MRPLERRLAALHGREYCGLTGNGTAALAAALQALGLARARVALGASVCFNVPLGVLLSGNEPLYLDAGEPDLGLDPAALAPVLGAVGAVVAVHAYGNPCRVAALERLAATAGVPLIEDAAVAQGVAVGTRPAGSFGAVSILSFGTGKVIDIGHGGAFLADDPVLFREMRRIEAAWPVYSGTDAEAVEAVSREHTRLYNAHFLAGDMDACAAFGAFALSRGAGFLGRFDDAVEARLARRLDALAALAQARRDNHARLAAMLAPLQPALEVLPPMPGAVPWRLSALVRRDRNGVFRALLARGHKVSSWFPTVDRFFQKRTTGDRPFPVCDRLGARIVNVWINENSDAEYFRTMTDAFVELLRERDET